MQCDLGKNVFILFSMCLFDQHFMHHGLLYIDVDYIIHLSKQLSFVLITFNNENKITT